MNEGRMPEHLSFGSTEPGTGAPPRRPAWRRRIPRWIAVGAAALALFGVLIGGTALAQSGTSSTPADLRESFLNRLAQNLGIGRDALDSAIKQSAEQTIDEAVASGKLTQEQGAILKQRIQEGKGLLPFGGRWGLGPRFPGFGLRLNTVASTLGITTDELRSELTSGKTLSQIIAEHGKTVDEVVNALVAEAKTKLDQAVADGRVTQQQADEILSALPDRLKQMIEENRLYSRHWHQREGAGL